MQLSFRQSKNSIVLVKYIRKRVLTESIGNFKSKRQGVTHFGCTDAGAALVGDLHGHIRRAHDGGMRSNCLQVAKTKEEGGQKQQIKVKCNERYFCLIEYTYWQTVCLCA